MSQRQLPPDFADLARFVDEWALSTEQQRYEQLHRHSLEHLRAFYEVMLPRMDAILIYLNQYTVQTLPADAKTLFDLAMTFSETAHPIDLGWADVDFPGAYRWDKFEFRTVSCADQ